MPKRKLIPSDEPLVSRPQRNTRAKKVFDPSDNYLPKKRNKPSVKPEKPTETTRKNNYEKKKIQNTKSKNSNANESLDSPSDTPSDVITYTEHMLISSHVQKNCSALCSENEVVCFLCTKSVSKLDLVDCPICLVTAHKNCILVDEPMWKFKLDKCVWLCKNCRERHCSKCLKGESRSVISRRCITCKVGLHLHCYESYDIKPLHTLQINMYVCIPCMTLAIHKLPEEEDEVEEDEIEEEEVEEEEEEEKVEEEEKEEEEDEENEENKIDDEVEDLQDEEREAIETDKQKDLEEEDAITIDSSSSSAKLISSDEEDEDLESNKSYDSLLDFDRDQDIILSIPDISNWSKYQVYEYLTDRLPKEILTKIIINDIDGHALKLLKRTDITFDMGLKLGPALKLFKEVRILQTQSTYHAVFWE